MTAGAGGSGGDEPPPPPPKRRRRPPPGLEGFDTGLPDDDHEPSAPMTARTVAAERSGSTAVPAERGAAAPVERSGSTTVPAERGAAAPVERSGSTTVPAERGTAAPVDRSAPTAPATGIVEGSGSPSPVADAGERPAPTSPPTAPLPGELPVFAATADVGDGDGVPTAVPASASGGAISTAAARAATDTAATRVGASSPATAATRRATDEPLVPSTYRASELRDAIGEPSARVRRRPPTDDGARRDDDDDDDLPGTRRGRAWIGVAVVSAVLGLGVAATLFIGHQNSGWFYLTCEADRVVAEQGRAFPPWGTERLDGKAWAPIKIPPEAECAALETESYPALVQRYRDMLVQRASVLLTASPVTQVDEANVLLEQALLHARANTDAARDARATIQRLLGDVVYWRASLAMQDAAKRLREAATQFDTAAQHRPRHVTDAGAWADYVRKIVGELEAGPMGATTPPGAPPPSAPSTSERPPAPPGVALPVEPDDAGSAVEAAPPTPDAGLPTGGVLL